MIAITKDKRLLGYELLNSYSNISHFVTTRSKGCSEGKYGAFNCSPYTEDKSKKVLLNQFSLLQSLKHPVKDLIIPQQVHNDASLVIDDYYFELPLFMRRAVWYRCIDNCQAGVLYLCLDGRLCAGVTL